MRLPAIEPLSSVCPAQESIEIQYHRSWEAIFYPVVSEARKNQLLISWVKLKAINCIG
jgi:hypothetical protein